MASIEKGEFSYFHGLCNNLLDVLPFKVGSVRLFRVYKLILHPKFGSEICCQLLIIRNFFLFIWIILFHFIVWDSVSFLVWVLLVIIFFWFGYYFCCFSLVYFAFALVHFIMLLRKGGFVIHVFTTIFPSHHFFSHEISLLELYHSISSLSLFHDFF